MSDFKFCLGFSEREDRTRNKSKSAPGSDNNLVRFWRLHFPRSITNILEAPDFPFRMLNHFGDEGFEVVARDPRHMVVPQSGGVIDDNPAAVSKREPHGRSELSATRPANLSVDLGVEEVLGSATTAQHDAVLEPRHGPLPNALADPVVPVEDTFGKSGGEEVPHPGGQGHPVRMHGPVVVGMGSVALVGGMEHKNRIAPEHRDLRILVPTHELEFSLAEERMTNDEDVEEEHREGPQIGHGARLGFTSNDLRGHELLGSENRRRGSVVDCHIVVVADEGASGGWVEKDVCEGYVAVAQALTVKIQKGVSQLTAEGRSNRRTNFDPTFEQRCESDVVARPKRHQIAESRKVVDFHELTGPEKVGVGRTPLDEVLDRLTLLLGSGAWEVPLERLRRACVVQADLEDRPLPSFADEPLDTRQATCGRKVHFLADLKHRVTCLTRDGDLSLAPSAPEAA